MAQLGAHGLDRLGRAPEPIRQPRDLTRARTPIPPANTAGTTKVGVADRTLGSSSPRIPPISRGFGHGDAGGADRRATRHGTDGGAGQASEAVEDPGTNCSADRNQHRCRRRARRQHEPFPIARSSRLPGQDPAEAATSPPDRSSRPKTRPANLYIRHALGVAAMFAGRSKAQATLVWRVEP